MFASTLNSRIMRSTMISRCSSPMPGDDRLRRLGIRVHAEGRILLRQLLQRDRQLVLIRLRLRLDGDVDDGVRELHRLEDDRVARRRTCVSPVRVSLSPIAAAMSPARTSSISSRLFACIWSRRPTRSRLSFVAL